MSDWPTDLFDFSYIQNIDQKLDSLIARTAEYRGIYLMLTSDGISRFQQVTEAPQFGSPKSVHKKLID